MEEKKEQIMSTVTQKSRPNDDSENFCYEGTLPPAAKYSRTAPAIQKLYKLPHLCQRRTLGKFSS